MLDLFIVAFSGSPDLLLVGDWATPLKIYEFVSWDDDIPNWMGKIKIMFQTTNQFMLEG